MSVKEGKQTFSSIENALRILKAFSMDSPELRVTDLAEELNLAKSTVHRLLTTMAGEGFVFKDPRSSAYSLGVSVLSLTNIVHSQLHILEDATPLLNMLTEKTRESSHIAILEGNEVIYLQKIESEYTSRITTHIGRRNPVHCTGSGQAILAFEKEGVIDQLLAKPLQRFTENTITDADKLRKRLHEVKQLGYVVNSEEFEKEIIAIGAPIFNEKEEVIASVNITGPVVRLEKRAKQHQSIVEVVHTAKRITELIKLRKRNSYMQQKPY
ncbi:IclR family transcriptional regulator [Sporosarcina sp. ACRSM]|uniref:IclR family transcriptional regulator n=1 Tax=Sporosarcina sp. ACRSM TaxID=2918216 RepID=UPI001EF4BEC0|nr:IclR family transcriptional regulator [Sporosarcina sp. ACRSM]MCG7336258.1 IclR family transcriptional regulator [Sporosarcina sp. ACRSM]